MGGGGGGQQPQQTSSVTSFKPWKQQKPYLTDLYRRAGDISRTPLEYYPNSTVAPQDQALTGAQDAAEARARSGNPLLAQSQDYTGRVLGGEFLDSNPYLDATYDRAAEGVTRNFNLATLPALETRFAGVNRLGSGAYKHGLSEAGRGLAGELAGMATDIYGGNYARERGVQDAASRFAPDLANADYTDINALADVGRERSGYAQSTLDDLVQRFNFGQGEPWQRLANYSGLIGSPTGGSTTGIGYSGSGDKILNNAFRLMGK
jgi:hypothetical protein